MKRTDLFIMGLIAASLGACDASSTSQPTKQAQASAPPAATPAPPAASPASPPPATSPAPAPAPAAAGPQFAAIPLNGGGAGARVRRLASSGLTAQAIDQASFQPGAPAAGQGAALVKLAVLLDRANASPGAIDGLPGENLANAMAAFEKRHGLPGDGALTPQALSALQAGGQDPIVQAYVVTAADEKGPFLHKLPAGFFALSKLPHLGYLDPTQELAERFHMSPGLLKAMNPGADFGRAGQTIEVVNPGPSRIQGSVARIEVDKTENQVRAYDGTGELLASFPATVGSTERPAPTGDFAVKSVTPDPDYVYDPSKLTFGDKSHGKFTIRPGPNNPVGTTWIALTLPTYGIHGTDDPDGIGKVASHGCVRLTNWDAAELGHAVGKGVPVDFVGRTEKS